MARRIASGPSRGGIPDGPAHVDADERRRLIAEAAYFRAERRGFAGGSAEQDWLEAEADIDRALSGTAH